MRWPPHPSTLRLEGQFLMKMDNQVSIGVPSMALDLSRLAPTFRRMSGMKAVPQHSVEEMRTSLLVEVGRAPAHYLGSQPGNLESAAYPTMAHGTCPTCLSRQPQPMIPTCCALRALASLIVRDSSSSSRWVVPQLRHHLSP